MEKLEAGFVLLRTAYFQIIGKAKKYGKRKITKFGTQHL